MTPLDLVYNCRLRLDDFGGDTGTIPAGYTYYWEYSDAGCLHKNAELIQLLNTAHREIALRTNCYRDASESDLCQISVVDGTNQYDLDSRIITVEDVRLASTDESLVKWTLRDYRETASAYTTTGTPTHYMEENRPFRIALYPIPDDDDTLYLTVHRYPLEDMTWSLRKVSLDEPADSLREALIQGTLSYAYQKRDADSEDGRRQRFHAMEFDKLVGKPVDYRTLENRRYNANLDISVRPKSYVPRAIGGTKWYENEDE